MKLTAGLVFLAEVLFLITFLASEPLELLADGGQILNRDAAFLYASRWRHGMSADSHLFMPGFFAVAATVWIWALQRRPSQMMREGALLTFLAMLTAVLLQPRLTIALLGQFQMETGLSFSGDVPPITLVGIFRSAYTLVTFAVGIVSIQIAIARWRLRPLVIPVVMNVVLSQIRPWTVGDFTSYWAQQTLALDPVGLLSSLCAVTAGFLMVLTQIIVSKWNGVPIGPAARHALPKQAVHKSELLLRKKTAIRSCPQGGTEG